MYILQICINALFALIFSSPKCKQLSKYERKSYCCRITTWKLIACGSVPHHKQNQSCPRHRTVVISYNLAGRWRRSAAVGISSLSAHLQIPLPHFHICHLERLARKQVPLHCGNCRRAPYYPGFKKLNCCYFIYIIIITTVTSGMW